MSHFAARSWKLFFAGLSICIFFFARTDLNQMVRLPVLFHHYQEHSTEQNGCSFWDFLTMHYGGPVNHADDRHGDHGKLPFKPCDAKLLVLGSTPAEPLADTLVRLFPSPILSEHHGYVARTRPGISVSVWQPPRLG